MPRAGERDIAKEHYWRQVFAEQRASKLAIVDFCRKNGIKPPQFYEWRRKVQDRDTAMRAEAREQSRAQRKHRENAAERETSQAIEFAEIQLFERSSTSTSPTCDLLEIEFASGTKVRLTGDSSLHLFESVVRILEKR